MPMNDRFKFRVWDKENEKFLHDLSFDIAYNGTLTLFCGIEGKKYINLNDNKRYILLQSTGLKDKNGTLIYEGDILGGIYENLDIFYCKECMQFELHANSYGCMCCIGDIHWYEVVEDNNKLEVIGNIYENKEVFNANN